MSSCRATNANIEVCGATVHEAVAKLLSAFSAAQNECIEGLASLGVRLKQDEDPKEPLS